MEAQIHQMLAFRDQELDPQQQQPLHYEREFSSVDDIINERIANGTAHERPFYVADLQDICQKHANWLKLLPRVRPFYAVKCNNLHEIVSLLAMLGTGFDCASKGEIDQILALGVEPSQIIYANPCKTRSFIKHANSVGVNLMTFDNELELYKISALHPSAELVLRIKGDDSSSRCKFNIKFGADLDNCHKLLELARDLNLRVVGVSFHNGSDCTDIGAYRRSLANSKLVFELGKQLGHSMRLLDIGGGFPGHAQTPDLIGDDINKGGIALSLIATVINAALDKYFPEFDPVTGLATNYEIIAEPGRYFVASAMTLASMVIAKRVERDEKGGTDCYMYYLNDGVYGAFNNIIFEKATPMPELIRGVRYNTTTNNNNNNNINNNKRVSSKINGVNLAANNIDERKLHSTVLWGPTCDSVDCIKSDFMFPELEVGEWVAFKNMGAYTCCVATNFNGFERAAVIIAV